jgi:hypothetical protein
MIITIMTTSQTNVLLFIFLVYYTQLNIAI